ncbi:MAG TPA: VgrG-related protein [Chloroflexota bacterium]|nr:VgrG-related protein [Chloroflexota bacterium]
MGVDARLFTSTAHVKLNGAKLSDAVMHRVSEVVVEQSLHLPDLFVLRLHDAGDDTNPFQVAYFKTLDADSFPIGGEVAIEMGRAEEPGLVFKGEITAVELEVGLGRPPMLVVRGYARSHRLHRGRQSKSYLNMTDSDVATKIGQSVGLQVQADSTTTVHPYLLQTNQTNWEFLKERAAAIGYELFVDDRTLHFRKPKNGEEMAAEQKLWDNLLSLRVKVSSAFQAESVVVRSWDPTSKEALVGQASKGSLAPKTGLDKSGAEAASAFGSATVYVVNRPVGTQSQATELAQAVYNALDGSYVQAEGLCTGDPSIRAGMTIEMKTIGSRLSGKYYLTSVTHTLSSEGYTTAFVVSGRQTDSLLELIDPRGDSAPALPSVVVGIVTDNTDPEANQGRVKVKFPWLVEDDQSWWARVASPMAGNGRGFYFLPEVDDEVLVAFEHGDPTRPFVLGALWNGKDLPPKKNSEVISSSQVNQRMIKTRAGHVITLDDTSGAELISIIDKTGKNLIKIESSSNKITIQADGDVAITAKGKVAVSAEQDVDVSANGNAKVKAEQNVDVEATGNATVKATGNASVQANGNLDLKGSMVNVEAQGTMSIKANGPLTLQGAVVNIN